uniref:Podocin n=1 Tax=Callorhinchus milii TaxID=7868 RepID=A0A4W3J8G0_CALMI
MTLAPVSNLCLIVESRSSVFFGQILLLMSYLVIIVTLPVSVWLCVKVIKEYERAVMFRLGRIIRGGLRGPGIFWFVPCIDTFKRVDLRTVAFSVATQEVLTKDSVTIMVDAVVFYRVVDPVVSVLSVVDANMATHLLAQTSLRTVLGTKNLTDILADREEMAEEMEVGQRDWVGGGRGEIMTSTSLTSCILETCSIVVSALASQARGPGVDSQAGRNFRQVSLLRLCLPCSEYHFSGVILKKNNLVNQSPNVCGLMDSLTFSMSHPSRPCYQDA